MRVGTALRTGLIGVGGLALVLAGCSAQGEGAERTSARPASDSQFASRRIASISLQQVQPVADRVFREHFRIDAGSSSANTWIARPAEAPDQERRGQVTDAFAVTPRRKRRLAELRLRPEGEGVVVQCRVLIQRLTVSERAAFSRERGDDRPTDTPIDRQGPSSIQSREEWTDAGRDRVTEQQILGTIQERLSTTRPAEEAAPPARP